MNGLTFMEPEEGFLALSGELVRSPEEARAVVIPFGLEATVSYGGGTGAGPAAMIAASSEVELFDEEFWCEPVSKYGVVTVVEPEVASPVAAALDQLEGLVETVLAAGKFPIVFGGEHAITPGAVRPYLKRWPDLAILHFDAHADLRDGYDGEHYSHAAALRRTMDLGVKTLVSCGIRNISKGEIPYLEGEAERITIHWGKDKASWNVEEIVAPFKGRPLYITFDVDGFDASLMPATGTPEPGGLFWADVMPIIKRACEVSSDVVGADVNELAPIEGWHASDFLAAKLAYKILNYALAR